MHACMRVCVRVRVCVWRGRLLEQGVLGLQLLRRLELLQLLRTRNPPPPHTHTHIHTPCTHVVRVGVL